MEGTQAGDRGVKTVVHRVDKLLTHAMLFLLAMMTGMLLPPLVAGVR
jgi:hypothetical protein